jgi:hypothetical protein
MFKVIKSPRVFRPGGVFAFRAFNMLKVILVTLFCLFGVTAAFALRSINYDEAAELAAAMPSHRSTAHSNDDPTETFAVNSAAKADKLSVVQSGDDPTKWRWIRYSLFPFSQAARRGQKPQSRAGIGARAPIRSLGNRNSCRANSYGAASKARSSSLAFQV